jgi:hypothetical protein
VLGHGKQDPFLSLKMAAGGAQRLWVPNIHAACRR